MLFRKRLYFRRCNKELYYNRSDISANKCITRCSIDLRNTVMLKKRVGLIIFQNRNAYIKHYIDVHDSMQIIYSKSFPFLFFFLGSYAVWQMEPRHKISNYKWVVLQLLLCVLWISLHYRYKQWECTDESKHKLSARSLIFNK